MPTDKYLSFNYKNPTFSTTAYSLYDDFKGFVINEGVDLTFFNPSNFSHEFMTPQFASQSYFMGTTQENREFTFPILLQGVTMAEYKTFLRWLNPRNEGILWFDYNENYGYDVKVNSISEGKFMVDPNCVAGVQNLTYNVELTVGFITKNDWASHWLPSVDMANLNPSEFNPAGNYIDNDLSEDYVYKNLSNKIVLKNNHNVTNFYKIHINLEQTGIDLVRIYIDGSLYFELSDGLNIDSIVTLYTQYGIAYDEWQKTFILNTGPNNSFGLEPGEEVEITYTVNGSSEIIQIEPISREII